MANPSNPNVQPSKKNQQTNGKGKKSVVGVVAFMLIAVALISGGYVSYINGWLDPVIDFVSPVSSSTEESSSSPVDVASLPPVSAVSTAPPPVEVQSQEVSAAPESVVSVPDLGDFRRPDVMQATIVTPGVDFWTNASATEADIQKEIDAIFAGMEKESLNTAIFNLNGGTSSLYNSGRFSNALQGDILAYAITRAKEKNLYVYGEYALNPLNAEGQRTEIDSTLLEAVKTDVTYLATTYQLDGILFTDYDNNANSSSYKNYLSLGNGMGYRNYMLSGSSALYETAADAVHTTNEDLQAGLLVEQVWANSERNSQGSETKAVYQQLYDGYADTRALVTSGNVDFLMVDTETNTQNEAIPFNAVTSWWGSIAQTSNIPMYILHSSDKLGSKEEGWKDPEQLAQQVEQAKTAPNYGGSVFSSYKAIQEDKTGGAQAAVKVLTTGITATEASESYVSKELIINSPEKKEFTTTEPTITVRGAADPKTPLTVNGEALTKDQNGYFSYKATLKAGKNTLTFTQGDQSITLNITRSVKVIQSVAPTGNISVEGNTQMTVTAYVYDGATVTATVGGIAVSSMQKDTAADDSLEGDSQYVRYVGTFTVPAGTSAAKALGTVSVKATYEGISESATGGTVTVNKVVQEVTNTAPAEGGKISGKIVSVVTNNAETFSTKTSDDISSADSYPLPKGALDRIVSDKLTYTEDGKTYEYYILASGNRVYASSISSTGAESLDANTVTGLTVKNDGRYTYVILANTSKPSYKMTKSSGTVAIALSDTSTVCSSLQSLTKNPLFSAANWSGSTLNLTVKNSFKGFYPYYEGNNLVLRFRNPVSTGSAVVVLDPGHSDSDPGAPGFFAGMDERELNRAVTNKTASILQNQGIRVLIVPTGGNTSLQARIDYASNNGADVFVSIHHNSSPNANASGTEVYYFNDASKALSSNVASGISSAAGFTNRGSKYSYYYVTRHQMFPAILAECGFVTSQTEYNRLIQDSTQSSIASGIASGIVSYLNSGYASSETGEQSVGGSASVSTGDQNNSANGTESSGKNETSSVAPNSSSVSSVETPSTPESTSSSSGVVDVTPVPWDDM